MVSSWTNGFLAFMLVLPPSVPNAQSSTASDTTKRDEGNVIGHAGIWCIRSEEIGFMISHHYWGEGYMTEVLATIIPIFWANGLEKVNADVDPENEASMKLLRKFAFRQVGGNRVKVDTGYVT